MNRPSADQYEKPLTGVVEEKRLLDRAGSEIPTSCGESARPRDDLETDVLV